LIQTLSKRLFCGYGGSIHIYSLHIEFRSRLGQRHGLQNTTLVSYFNKKYLGKNDIFILLWKYFSKQIYSYNFYICKINNLKAIDDLYCQCLIQTLSKTTFKSYTEGVLKQQIWYNNNCFEQEYINDKIESVSMNSR